MEVEGQWSVLFYLDCFAPILKIKRLLLAFFFARVAVLDVRCTLFYLFVVF